MRLAVAAALTVPCLAFTGPHVAFRGLAPARAQSSLRMVDPASLWADYQGALEAAPLLTKSITAAVLFSGADLCAQQLERSKAEEPKDLEFARSARFFALGLFAQAPWNHYFYMYLDKALPPTEEVFTSTTAIKLVSTAVASVAGTGLVMPLNLRRDCMFYPQEIAFETAPMFMVP
eukprot:TRINITY_DN2498_c0_g1_i2.p1 TRINITY_DN2498_c0_g1~~TRINITY_DN2498_c0_g1_i2.p1  ORF type:complete len:176 (+),score=20.88 TRINITY_DN2498_c0_g1_i2:38-565(+)